MSDINDIKSSLKSIREAATRVLHASGNEEFLNEFCKVMHRELPTIAKDHDVAGVASILEKMASTIETALRRLAPVRILPADRARLAVSYARSLRAAIDELMRILGD